MSKGVLAFTVALATNGLLDVKKKPAWIFNNVFHIS
jgi:hypothetical protein